jgi:general secretion pathway protein J
MMRHPERTDRQGGFTLLEMLVAITVLALLMIGLTQGVRTGFAFWASQTRRSAEVTELDATARVLRNLLTDIPIRSAASGAGQAAILFEGHSALLTFVGDLPTGFGDTRRAKIDVALRGRTSSSLGHRIDMRSATRRRRVLPRLASSTA